MKVTSNMTIKAVGYDKYGTRTPTASKSFTAGEYFGTFDAKFYADKYPDLKQAFGYDTNQLWNHLLHGRLHLDNRRTGAHWRKASGVDGRRASCRGVYRLPEPAGGNHRPGRKCPPPA